MFVAVIAPKYVLLISQGSYRHFPKLTDSILYLTNTRKSSPFNSTHYVVLYPQNGDGVVTIDPVMYQAETVVLKYLQTFQCLVRCRRALRGVDERTQCLAITAHSYFTPALITATLPSVL